VINDGILKKKKTDAIYIYIFRKTLEMGLEKRATFVMQKMLTSIFHMTNQKKKML
jgi:hypothetical protein